MALGGGAVPAAGGAPERVIPIIAAVEPSPQFFGAAGGNVGKCLLVRGHHPLAVFREVLGNELADDVRQLDLPLRGANARISHGWASFPRRGRRWSDRGDDGVDPATDR